jgi:hypothetical protein
MTTQGFSRSFGLFGGKRERGGKEGRPDLRDLLASRIGKTKQISSVSEIEFCTLHTIRCSQPMDLGLHIAVHARKKLFLRHTPGLRGFNAAHPITRIEIFVAYLHAIVQRNR